MHVFCGSCLRARMCKEMTQLSGVAHACTFPAAVRLTEDALALLIIKSTRVLTCVKLSVMKHVSVQTPKINVYLEELLLWMFAQFPSHTLLISINVRNLCEMESRVGDRRPLIRTAARASGMAPPGPPPWTHKCGSCRKRMVQQQANGQSRPPLEPSLNARWDSKGHGCQWAKLKEHLTSPPPTGE